MSTRPVSPHSSQPHKEMPGCTFFLSCILFAAAAAGSAHQVSADAKAAAGLVRLPLHRTRREQRNRRRHQKKQWISLLQIKERLSPNRVENWEPKPPPVDVYVALRVGTPPQVFSVAVDTSSSNLLLTSASCSSLGCLSHHGYAKEASSTAEEGSLKEPISVKVAAGRATGDIVLDKVCLGSSGDACAKTPFIQLTSMSQETFRDFPFDGVLGIGLSAEPTASSFSLLENIVEAGKAKHNMFSVWLATEDDHEESEIAFGGYPEDRLDSELVWLPTSRSLQAQKTSDLWKVDMSNLYVGNEILDTCGRYGCSAVFDTGTSVIAGPSNVMEALEAALDVKEDCSNAGSLPPLGFAFGQSVLYIESQDYVRKIGHPSRCYHQFMSFEPQIVGQRRIILGDPFLQRYLTVFDRESLKVGLGVAKHSYASPFQRQGRLMRML